MTTFVLTAWHLTRILLALACVVCFTKDVALTVGAQGRESELTFSVLSLRPVAQEDRNKLSFLVLFKVVLLHLLHLFIWRAVGHAAVTWRSEGSLQDLALFF